MPIHSHAPLLAREGAEVRGAREREGEREREGGVGEAPVGELGVGAVGVDFESQHAAVKVHRALKVLADEGHVVHAPDAEAGAGSLRAGDAGDLRSEARRAVTAGMAGVREPARTRKAKLLSVHGGSRAPPAPSPRGGPWRDASALLRLLW